MLRSLNILFALLTFLSILQPTLALSPGSFSRRRHHARIASRRSSPSISTPSTAVDSPSSVLVPRGNDASGRKHLMCLSDSWTRVLQDQLIKSRKGRWNSPDECMDACAAQGYSYAGLEYGYQCFCGNKINRGGLFGTGLFAPKELDSSKCAEYICRDGSSSCGGTWAIDLYSISSSISGSSSSSSVAVASSTSSSSVSVSVTTSASSAVVTSTSPSSTSASASQTSFSAAGVPSTSSVAMGSSSMATMISSSSAIAASSSSPASSVVSTSISSAAVPSSTAAWTNQGCISDSFSRSLNGYSEERLSSWTVATCTDLCKSKGFALAGIEVAVECYCGNSLAPTTVQLPPSSCNWYCFDSPDICGGPWAISVFSDQPLSAFLSSPPAPVSSSSAIAPSSASSTAVASATATAAPPSSTTSIPTSSGNKAVYVHHMVGNTYPYTFDTWLSDIKMASAAGFDGFALNIGSDTWQWAQVASAYAAAAASNTGFKLFLSFDMTVLPCSSISHGSLLQAYITTYGSHPSQATYNNAILASTFAGSDCSFGVSSSWDTAWQTAFKTPLARAGYSVWFVPSVFSDANQLGGIGAIDGELNWNSGWPMSGGDLDFSSDNQYMNSLGPSKSYMAAVSPGFYTHYGVNSWNKNWIFRSDDWLFAYRWEQLIANRDRIDLVEALTWNDYGESSYIGPIEGAQPNSQAWVDGYDHTPLLAVNSYYSTAFKTGVYPTITTDRVYLTARTHPAMATATNDWVPRPNHAEWTDDNFYALIFATSPCTVTLSSSSSSSSTLVSAGVTRLSLPLTVGGGMSVQMTRNGVDVVDFTPAGYQFVQNPATYNFNYQYYASS